MQGVRHLDSPEASQLLVAGENERTNDNVALCQARAKAPLHRGAATEFHLGLRFQVLILSPPHHVEFKVSSS